MSFEQVYLFSNIEMKWIHRKAFGSNYFQTKKFVFTNNKCIDYEDQDYNLWTALSGLTYLHYLEISNSDLKNIPENAFEHIGWLEVLSIYRNDLRHIQPKVFHKLNMVNTLKLYENNISVIEDYSFDFPPAMDRT